MKNTSPTTEKTEAIGINRRKFISVCSAVGLGSTLLPGTLTAVAQEAETITSEMVKAAEKLAGLSLTDKDRETIVGSLNGNRSFLKNYERIREKNLPNSVSPALIFNPVLGGMKFSDERKLFIYSKEEVKRPPGDIEQVAYYPVTKLARLLETRQVTSTELTKMYISRLKKYNNVLNFVVTMTEERALQQAAKADNEIASGNYRGPLHGVPWGAKDLLAVKNYKTTWGAEPYKDQVIDVDASVVQKLDEAGAVLVAKLTLGALARGDRWFGGVTRNPWNTEQGSSGSSAGPGSATAAGCVGFSIGTETRGSILSPSARCGVTGLRPTFGRVSKYGAMALTWSMDKIGPMCRSVEDCAIVFNAIQGPDDKDNSIIDKPFNWDPAIDVKKLRIGYLKSRFEREISDDPDRAEAVKRQRAQKRLENEVLSTIRGMGINLVPIEINVDSSDLNFILSVEAAAAFDELMMSNRDRSMKGSSRPDAFRLNRFVPAVEYIQANRLRTVLMQELDEAIKDIDVWIEPTHSNTGLTNLTGHPAVVLPNGFIEGTPASITFMGKLFGDAETLAVAKAYQDATDFHLRRPSSF